MESASGGLGMLAEGTLASYVPALVHRRVASTPTPERHADRYPAAILFADISGFTQLTESLADQQAGGAEGISRVLNSYFGQISDLVSDHGGDLVRLAGDAAVAMWGERDERTTMSELVAAAARCGLAIRVAIHGYELHGSQISVRVGVACGEVFEAHVGGVEGHWEFLVGGQPLVDVVEAQRRAQPGHVVLAPGAWSLVRRVAEGNADANGYVSLLSVASPPEPPLQVAEVVAPQDLLRAYVPDAVLSRSDAGQTAWLAELRQVSVVFVRVGGIDYSSPDALERLDEALCALQVPLYRYEGAIRQFLVDDKGTILIAAFGLPPHAHEDDAVRAVRTALAMREAAMSLRSETSIGIATGRVFCGPIGSLRRREYALVGDVVIIAARLMEAAPGDVLCDAETQRRSHGQLPFEKLPSFVLKGKSRTVALFRPLQDAIDAAGMPIVGRAKEQEAIEEALRRLRAGNGGIVLIEGEPGVGKSRLLREALLSPDGIAVLRGNGDSIERSRPYHAWTPIFAAILRIDGAGIDARAFGSDPEIGRSAPLLNSVVPLDLPDNDLTREMTGQVRADNTKALLLRLLQRHARAGPLLVAIEDAHWMDSASWALALATAEEIPNVLMLVTSRPMPEPPREQAELLSRGAIRLVLETLSPTETLALIRQRLGVKEVSLDVVRRIQRRSAGNPLFVEELTAALRDQGLLAVMDQVCQFAPGVDPERLELPSTVQGVITARIDQLGTPEQLTLKIGSVIGAVFPYRVLHDVHPIAQDRPRLIEHVDKLRRLGLIALHADGSEPQFAFKHEITRDVTYGLLTQAQRSQLHAAVAQWYEREHADDVAPLYPLLAHHWREAGDQTKTVGYLEGAGEQALRNGAYREAVVFLEDALSSGEVGPARSRSRTGRVERMLAESYLGLGRHRDGHEHLRIAVDLLGRPEPRSLPQLAPRVLLQVARQFRHRVAPWSIRAARGEEADRLIEAARAYIRLVEVHWFANDTPLLAHAGITALNLAERVGASPELARAYAIMCLAAGSIPQRQLAEMYARRSVATARDLGQPHALAYSLFITSVYAIGTGQWQRIEVALQEASELFEEVGDRRLLGDARTVKGMSLLYRGRFGESVPIFEAVRSGGMRHENVQHQVWGSIGTAEALFRTGETQPAADLLGTVLVLLERSPDRAEELRAQGLLAAIREAQGERGAGTRAADRATELIGQFAAPTAHYLLEGYAGVAEIRLRLWEDAGPSGAREAARRSCAALERFATFFPIGRPRALLLSGRSRWLDGDHHGAMQRWRRAAVEADRLGMTYEQARAHLELGRRVKVQAEAEQHRAAARRLFEAVGAGPELAELGGPSGAATRTA